MQNFTAADLVQTALATLALALFLLPTGYLVGLAANPFGMRRASAAEKLLFSAVFSVAFTPILAVLLTRFTSYTVTLVFFLLLNLVSAWTLVPALGRVRRLSDLFAGVERSSWLALAMMLAWFLVVVFSLADLQFSQRLYVNYVAFDHSVRVPFVEAASRGVPPRNPFYGIGEVPVLRYFYYWYVVCALPVKLFGLGAKACLNASVFWSGVSLASLVPLYLKHFCGERREVRSKSLIGISLLTITGLDVVPYALQILYYRTLPADMEWWDTNQVTSWMGSLLWVPHHVASLTACMAGVLLLSLIDEEAPPARNGWAAALAGVAFASTAGLSVYVAFPLALFAIAWTLLTLGEKRFRTFFAYLFTGVFALLLSWPYLSDLLSKPVKTQLGSALSTAPSRGESFAYFSIREFLPALHWLKDAGIQNPVLLDLSKVLVLPIIYVLEFGFFAVILVLFWRRQRHSPGAVSRKGRMAWWMFAICLLAMTFVKSKTTGFNDLGWRGMLPVQFLLLVWAAPLVHEVFFRSPEQRHAALRARWVRPVLLGTLAVGLASTAVQLSVLRVYAPLAERGGFKRWEEFLGDGDFGRRTYWMRQGFTRLNALAPADATVQYNPVRHEVVIAHLYSARQAAMGDAFCGSAFGGDAANCRKYFPLFATAFNAPDAVRSWNLDRFCDDFRVNVLVATDADPVWEDPRSWVWTRRALVANPALRAVPCGTAPMLSGTE